MNVRGKVTPTMRDRVWALHRDGKSNRAIAKHLEAEGMPLSRQGVADVLEGPEPTPTGAATGAAAAVPKGAASKPRRPARRPTDEPEDEPPTLPPVDADEDHEDEELEAERAALDALLERRPEALPRLPPDASLPARAVWWDLVQVRAEVAAMRPKVRSGAMPAGQWLQLVKEATRLAERLEALLPPVPPDAAKDPANIQARAMVHAHVLQSIEAAEARAGRLCPRCRDEVVIAVARSA